MGSYISKHNISSTLSTNVDMFPDICYSRHDPTLLEQLQQENIDFIDPDYCQYGPALLDGMLYDWAQSLHIPWLYKASNCGIPVQKLVFLTTPAFWMDRVRFFEQAKYFPTSVISLLYLESGFSGHELRKTCFQYTEREKFPPLKAEIMEDVPILVLIPIPQIPVWCHNGVISLERDHSEAVQKIERFLNRFVEKKLLENVRFQACYRIPYELKRGELSTLVCNLTGLSWDLSLVIASFTIGSKENVNSGKYVGFSQGFQWLGEKLPLEDGLISKFVMEHNSEWCVPKDVCSVIASMLKK